MKKNKHQIIREIILGNENDLSPEEQLSKILSGDYVVVAFT